MTADIFSLSGKRALACGSTQGIGRACAMLFARLGASVTLAARNEDGLKRVLGELPAGDGQKHEYFVADFNNPQQVRDTAAAHFAQVGPAHILLNNTGGPPSGTILAAKP